MCPNSILNVPTDLPSVGSVPRKCRKGALTCMFSLMGLAVRCRVQGCDIDLFHLQHRYI